MKESYEKYSNEETHNYAIQLLKPNLNSAGIFDELVNCGLNHNPKMRSDYDCIILLCNEILEMENIPKIPYEIKSESVAKIVNYDNKEQPKDYGKGITDIIDNNFVIQLENSSGEAALRKIKEVSEKCKILKIQSVSHQDRNKYQIITELAYYLCIKEDITLDFIVNDIRKLGEIANQLFDLGKNDLYIQPLTLKSIAYFKDKIMLMPFQSNSYIELSTGDPHCCFDLDVKSIYAPPELSRSTPSLYKHNINGFYAYQIGVILFMMLFGEEDTENFVEDLKEIPLGEEYNEKLKDKIDKKLNGGFFIFSKFKTSSLFSEEAKNTMLEILPKFFSYPSDTRIKISKISGEIGKLIVGILNK